MNLFDVYLGRAQERGDSAAIRYVGSGDDTVLTWQGVIARARAISKVLSEAGAKPGSRWAVKLSDSPDIIPSLLAVWLCESVVVLMDPEWGSETAANVLRHSGAQFHLEAARELSVSALPRTREVAQRPELAGGVAMLAYTSGSTGAAKGIPLHHDRLFGAMLSGCAVVEGYRDAPTERFASSMRLSGFGVLVLHFLMNAVSGTEVCVLPRLNISTAAHYWGWIREHRIQAAVLVPPLFELLIQASRKGPDQEPPLFINSSGPLSPASHARFQELFGARILNCYGQTEASFAVTMGDTSPSDAPTQSIGRAFNLQTRLVGTSGVVAGQGEGELEVRGPTVSDGYYDNPDANAETMVNGWLRTGDLARRDASGKYWIVGRRKEAVMKGGVTVYLTEVEQASLPYPGVSEAMAVRLDLDGGNEDIGLLVCTLPGTALDTQALRLDLSQKLGTGRAPRRVVEVDGPLPRLGQNKPDRRAAKVLWDRVTIPAT